MAVGIVTMVLAGGCGDGARWPASPDIAGLVVDTDGEPVAGVAIVLNHALPELTPDKPQTGVSFALAETGPVRCWVADDCRGEVLRVLIDDILPAGTHTVIWDGRDSAGRRAASGPYTWHLESGDLAAQRDVWLAQEAVLELPDPADYRHHAVTDERGHFSFGQECLGFDTQFDVLDENGVPVGGARISRRVRLFALRAGRTVAVSPWLDVDPETGAYARLTVDR